MRAYFITGGTGFVGRALVKELLKRDDTYSILCLTRGRPNLLAHQKLNYLFGDITSVDFPEASFTDIIHGAAEANDLLCPDKSKYYYDVVEGSRRLFALANKVKPKRLMYISSGAVIKGDSIYCKAKRMAESLCPAYANVVRIYSLVGDEMPMNGQYALGKFIHQALNGKIEFYESGSTRSYLHVDDCARWLGQILDHNKSHYDIGSLKPISIRELAYMVGEIANVPVEEVERKDFHQTASVYLPKRIPPFCFETISLKDAIESVIYHHPHLESKAAT